MHSPCASHTETTVGDDQVKLALLGWSGKAESVSQQPPGPTHTLEAPRQGEGWVFLDWKEPADGGAVASYKIERRLQSAGDWALISVAFESEATLNNQERNKDWEYRVIAVNRAGEGVPSNTVAVVV
jgi:hypothetical protein